MYCPSCRDYSVCKAIPIPEITFDPADYSQRMYMLKHEDIQMFRRGRQCLKCHYQFITAEVDEDFLSELVELRDALKEVKEHAELYAKESASASKALNKLTKSLSILQALKVYIEED